MGCTRSPTTIPAWWPLKWQIFIVCLLGGKSSGPRSSILAPGSWRRTTARGAGLCHSWIGPDLSPMFPVCSHGNSESRLACPTVGLPDEVIQGLCRRSPPDQAWPMRRRWRAVPSSDRRGCDFPPVPVGIADEEEGDDASRVEPSELAHAEGATGIGEPAM